MDDITVKMREQFKNDKTPWVRGLGLYIGELEDRLQVAHTRLNTFRDRIKVMEDRILKVEFEITTVHPKPHDLWGCAPQLPPKKPSKKNVSKPSKDEPDDLAIG